MPNCGIVPNRSLLFLFTIWAFTFSAWSTAQTEPEDRAPSDAFQLKVKSNLVLVRVVVPDKNGKPVRYLKKEDFRIFDQGKEQTIPPRSDW
ncbi:MAG TPA: hypothetical protein VGI45_08625 [Terracidiphilus sp.]